MLTLSLWRSTSPWKRAESFDFSAHLWQQRWPSRFHSRCINYKQVERLSVTSPIWALLHARRTCSSGTADRLVAHNKHYVWGLRHRHAVVLNGIRSVSTKRPCALPFHRSPSIFIQPFKRQSRTEFYLLLTPWRKVLLEKLTGSQLVKKFPAFYGTRRFITAFTNARHLSLSCARPIQFTSSNFISWRPILILSPNLCLGLPSGLFPSGFFNKALYTPLLSPIRATSPTHLILLDLITRILGEEYRSLSSHYVVFSIPLTEFNWKLKTSFREIYKKLSFLRKKD